MDLESDQQFGAQRGSHGISLPILHSAFPWSVEEGNWHLLRMYWMPGTFCVIYQCDLAAFWLCDPGQVISPL